MQRKAGAAGYVARIREVKTLQVVQDVLVQDSQIGILYVSDLIASYMHRLFEKNNLEFIPFINSRPTSISASVIPGGAEIADRAEAGPLSLCAV